MDIDLSNRKSGEVPPDIIVIGAMRAGTTTLYEMMRATGVVSVPRMKETDFFLRLQYKRGLSWFNSQYDDLTKPIVDVSPNYAKRYVFPGTARRIHETNPDVKLVYILRDPIKRAISHYRHRIAMGYETKLPHETTPRQGESVSDASLYHAQLEHFLEYFPLEQIEILEFEELIADEWGILAGLFERLGLPEFSVEGTEVHTNSTDQLQSVPHWWGQMRNKPAVEWLRSKMPRNTVELGKSILFHGQGNKMEPAAFPEESIEALKDHLTEDVAALRALTGRDFKHWSI